ncbi:unnamed protein product [Enterobius vermicularis]|uniref:Uncharacterized protein n=1 Tax=Enterobius vermicularis TaxID=51028 RepID=A0A0N4UT07_ENTVE|nr:unnamed protein product [Enterobius vermicularis]
MDGGGMSLEYGIQRYPICGPMQMPPRQIPSASTTCSAFSPPNFPPISPLFMPSEMASGPQYTNERISRCIASNAVTAYATSCAAARSINNPFVASLPPGISQKRIH